LTETIAVRAAEPRDFQAVTSLLQELGRPQVLGTPGEGEARDRYLRWLEAPDREAWVAEIDGLVVGFIDLIFVPRLNFDGPQAWVPDLIVLEATRSRGAGAALLARAEAAALQGGAFALMLESANWRESAHAFYLREGMTDAAKQFMKVLGDVAWPPVAPSGAP
jgi:GNAT superfamily N-acetyltransferase